MTGRGQSSSSYSGFSWEHPAKDFVPSWGWLRDYRGLPLQELLPWVFLV